MRNSFCLHLFAIVLYVGLKVEGLRYIENQHLNSPDTKAIELESQNPEPNEGESPHLVVKVSEELVEPPKLIPRSKPDEDKESSTLARHSISHTDTPETVKTREEEEPVSEIQDGRSAVPEGSGATDPADKLEESKPEPEKSKPEPEEFSMGKPSQQEEEQATTSTTKSNVLDSDTKFEERLEDIARLTPIEEHSNQIWKPENWDYAQKGNDWKGICRTGSQQSPVNLSSKGLDPSQFEGFAKLLTDGSDSLKSLKWEFGDFFYSYAMRIEQISVFRSDKKFLIGSYFPNEPLGLLMPVGLPDIWHASHIEFHSPSEHTFEGEGNRRAVEMQIWHDSNMSEEDYMIGSSSLATLVGMALDGDSDSKVQVGERSKKRRVVSLTFVAEEIGDASKQDVESLPSEAFFTHLLAAEAVPTDGKWTNVNLKEPLNLSAILLTLQLFNVDFFQYEGSETSPGCQENVTWYVASVPLPLSTPTMQKFYKLVNSRVVLNAEDLHKDGNYREIQNSSTNPNNSGYVSLVQGLPFQVLMDRSARNGITGTFSALLILLAVLSFNVLIV